MQRALMQYFQPQNQAMVIKALKKAGREDLIGFDGRCLVQPMRVRFEREGMDERRPGARGARPNGERQNPVGLRGGRSEKRVERREERSSQPRHGGNPGKGGRAERGGQRSDSGRGRRR